MMPNEDRLAALNAKSVDFIDQRGAHCIQENGQRKYGGPPPGWEGPPPPKGTEVHVSELPQDCFEFELIPLFEKVGRIYETRLMMEFNSYNKGYCFIRYATVAEAKMAISVFNDYEIRPGHKISVAISVDNCRLFLGGIPNDKTREEVMQLLSNSVSGLKDVILYKNVSNRKKNRGFCFLEFHNHRQAAIARRHMIPEKVGYWGRHLIVDWAEPEPDFIEDDELVKMTDLYVRNLADETTEERLKQIIANIVPLQYVTRIKKVKDFAFVHFSCKKAADKVLQELDGRVIDGEVVSVVWKRPSKESRENWLSRIKYNSRPKRNLTSQRLPDKHQLNEIYQQQLQLQSSPRSTASDELNNNRRSPQKSSSCEKHDSSKLNYDVNLTERRKKKTKPSNLALHNVKCTACAMNGVPPSLDTSFSYLTLGEFSLHTLNQSR
nr:PREDICTED: probable RNA-binding protein 46 [Bemisia tabaci]